MKDRTPVVSRQNCYYSNDLKQVLPSSSRRTTKLYFMGSDNGLLGVGGPEIVRDGDLFTGFDELVVPFLKLFTSILTPFTSLQ
jgi:hypothetical protein